MQLCVGTLPGKKESTEKNQSSMSDIRVEKSQVDLTAEWILNSGIQSDKGGFFAWYNLQDKSYSYLYSEITGYGITALLFLYKILGEKTIIDKAEQAADWIIKSSMHSCGGIKTRLYEEDEKADKRYSFTGENIFSFDTGMVLYGVVNLYNLTKKTKYLQISETLADFLIDKMQNQDGSLSPIYDAKTGKRIELEDKWSNQRSGFHAKVSMGLVDLYIIKQNKKYYDAAVKLCEYAIATQETSGRFITDKINKTTHLHPHCYTAEGLWYTGTSLKKSSFVESAKKATKWAFKYMSSSGINELYDPLTKTFGVSQRSDIIAQVLRLGLIFSISHRIDELKSVLLGYQYCGEDLSQKGGFFFSKDSKHVNSWCTMFAIQALANYQHRGLKLEEGMAELLI